MTEPWLQDACSLVDAFRAKTLSPLEALEGSLAAIEDSELNAVCHVDADAARARAAAADVSLPFGGVPIGVKELEHVEGWPFSEASLVFADRRSAFDSTHVARLRASGAVLAAQTTASEFGGVNCTSHETARCHPEPVGHRTHPRWILGWNRSRGRRWAAAHRHGWRRWRIDPHPGRIHRAVRAEGHLRAHPPGPADPAAPVDRHPGLPVPLGARHGPVVRRDPNGFDARDTLACPPVVGLGGRVGRMST